MFDVIFKVFGSGAAAVAAAGLLSVPGGLNAQPEKRPVISVADFGARPDDGRDDTAAIRAALARCKTLTDPILVFPRGRYELRDARTSPNRRALEIIGCRGLTIDGNGSELIFSGLVTPFYFENCRNVTLKRLTVDWDRPPFSQGRVTAMDGDRFTVALDPQYPMTSADAVYGVMDFDPERRVAVAGFDLFDSAVKTVEHPDPLTCRITTIPNVSGLPGHAEIVRKALAGLKGKTVVLRHYHARELFSCWGLRFYRCADITVEDVNLYTCVGLGFHASVTHNLICRRLNVVPRPGSNRLMSATLDGWHCSFISGHVLIEDCRFENLGDDGINLYSKYLAVARRDGDALRLKVASQGWQGPTPEPGDRMSCCRQSDLAPYAELTVKTAQWDRNSKTFRVEFRNAPPAGLALGDLLINRRYEPRALIRNCTVKGNRARGILISSPHVTVENCRIERCTHAGMMIFADVRRQARVPSDLVIRRNRFIDCGGAAIYLYALGAPGAAAPAAARMARIEISGNTFSYRPAPAESRFKFEYPRSFYWQAGICACSTLGLDLRDNLFQGDFNPAIAVNRSAAPIITGNRADPAAAILIDPAGVTAPRIADNPGLTLKTEAPAAPMLWQEIHYSALR